MDTDGYPDETELAHITAWKWDNPEGWEGLLAYVKARWEYADCGYWQQRGRTYRLHTAGWSGNESIIGALQENHMFWALCWVQSRRGGHYIFRIRPIKESKNGRRKDRS